MHYGLIAEGLESKINKFMNECCIKKTSGGDTIIFRTENVIVIFNEVKVSIEKLGSEYRCYITLFKKRSSSPGMPILSDYLCQVVIPIDELDNLVFDSTYGRIKFSKEELK